MDEQYVTRHEYMERIGRSDDRMHELDRRVSRVEDLAKELNSMAISIKGILTTLENMQAEQKEQGDRLKKIEEEPADNWKKFMWTIFACAVTGVMTGVMGWILAKGGL